MSESPSIVTDVRRGLQNAWRYLADNIGRGIDALWLGRWP